MPIILTLGEVLLAFGEKAKYVGDSNRLRQRASKISTDSRTNDIETLFFALRGERFDGHNFVRDTFAQKACAAVVDRHWYDNQKELKQNFIVVEDTLQALQQLGQTIRQRWGQPLIAITGSNGKTTAKELIASVLGQENRVHKTSGNFNNHIGLPLTLTELSYSHEIAITEMGANHSGEIADLCKIAAPQFGLITNIGHAHTEHFGDINGVVEAKQELFQYLLQHDRIAFLNVDDVRLVSAHPAGLKTVTYGIENPAQVSAQVRHIDDQGHATIVWKDTNIRLPLPGVHHASNALAAIAVSSHFDVTTKAIKQGIEACTFPAQRMQVMQRGDITVVNDAYNANPESVKAALEFLATMSIPEKGHRIAVLGDMLELGAEAAEEHRRIGELIKTLPIQAVFAYGQHMGHLIKAIGQHCWAIHFTNKQNLFNEMTKSVHSGDLILIKGSRSMAMEEVIQYLPESSLENI